ncbi:hypothetical protein IGI04_042345 [Brassica rapa subsp. trilocularis]|uniref:Uncharacterized protein n=1 Tax=Brassica rapa subsp. trilocularis TaxID=1813537 RepID=A0ABQ7KK77_BRACM|nr:hypothetical protein IGI04_042345 [Brassica rapa subsp. trilocularis]
MTVGDLRRGKGIFLMSWVPYLHTVSSWPLIQNEPISPLHSNQACLPCQLAPEHPRPAFSHPSHPFYPLITALGYRARFIRTWFQLPLSSKLTPMPFPNQEEASWSFGCSTSSRRRCAHQWRPEAVLGRSPLSHGRPEERRPLEACPSHSHSLSKKKGESFQLVPGMATQK